MKLPPFRSQSPLCRNGWKWQTWANVAGKEKWNKKAVAFWRLASRKGDPQGTSNWAASLAVGYGCRKDLQRAVGLYRKAAEEGCVAAMHNLGWCYCSGEGVPKDFSKARLWMSKAAAKDLPVSLHYMGLLHLHGDGAERDLSAAFQYFRKAAWKGNADAQYDLALCYANGEGCVANPFLSRIWMSAAYIGGCESAVEAMHCGWLHEGKNHQQSTIQGVE